MSSTFITRLDGPVAGSREIRVETGRNDGKIELVLPGGEYVSLEPKQALFIGMDLVRAYRNSTEIS